MEVTKEPYWSKEAHPNYNRWKRGREIAVHRAAFLRSILENEVNLTGKVILDIGSGIGGTASVLSDSNICVSLDISFPKLLSQDEKPLLHKVCADGRFLPFKPGTFDVIILQDVIEHIDHAEIVIKEVFQALKEGGIIYISSPNKFSSVNILSDPHWGLPLISLLGRKAIKKYVLPILRKSERHRNDFAALYSIRTILNFISDQGTARLWTKYATSELFNGNKGIIWSDFHLKFVKAIRFFGFHHLYLKIVNDKFGLITWIYTPTFYITVKKQKNYSYFVSQFKKD